MISRIRTLRTRPRYMGWGHPDTPPPDDPDRDDRIRRLAEYYAPLIPPPRNGGHPPGRPRIGRGQHWLAEQLGIAQSTVSTMVIDGRIPRKARYDDADVAEIRKKIAPH